MDGIWKFDPNGRLLWHWTPDAGADWLKYMNPVPSMAGTAIFTSTVEGYVFAVNTTTGTTIWRERHAMGAEMDTPYVEVQDGVVLTCFERTPDAHNAIAGNRKIVAANATDGRKLWEYWSDTVLWNFQPQFTQNGTFLVMDIHGGLRHLSVSTGEQLMYVPPPEPWMQGTFTDGGVILGPGAETAYSCSNFQFGGVDTPGALRAYRMSDMQMLWEKVLPQPCVSWPASNGRTVVVPVGGLPIPSPPYWGIRWLPYRVQLAVSWFSNALGESQGWLWGNAPRRMLVMAFDAETGEPQWKYDRIKPWYRFNSRGDEDNQVARYPRWPFRAHCGPASWSAPTIGGDGTVYAAGMDGILYAIGDANSDGFIDDSEVSTLDLGASSLHAGASFAPGLMTFASCSGVFAFKT
uniref:Pyrrolo-quinoline quinone repeat domain-containing protein n=1 Tax=Alexandrium catenella TaxID=2925 RepID=A0A7S1W813_ALECA